MTTTASLTSWIGVLIQIKDNTFLLFFFPFSVRVVPSGKWGVFQKKKKKKKTLCSHFMFFCLSVCLSPVLQGHPQRSLFFAFRWGPSQQRYNEAFGLSSRFFQKFVNEAMRRRKREGKGKEHNEEKAASFRKRRNKVRLEWASLVSLS